MKNLFKRLGHIFGGVKDLLNAMGQGSMGEGEASRDGADAAVVNAQKRFGRAFGPAQNLSGDDNQRAVETPTDLIEKS